jgi:hypothetical protein
MQASGEVGPLVLITGSANSGRTDYKPPITNAATAGKAAERIGAALANAGCRIAVFSAEPQFIEAAVVRGFVAALRGKSKHIRDRIQVRAPATAPVPFPERVAHPNLFLDIPDQYSHWIRSFLRASRDADGVVLVGGGRSTLVMGHIALAFRLPILPLAAFGGAAQDIWRSIRPAEDLPSADECNAMANPDITDAHAAELVTTLLSQWQRRIDQATAAAQAERIRIRWLTIRGSLGTAVLLVAIILGWTAAWYTEAEPGRQLALYLIGPLGGCAAALVGSSILEEPPRTVFHTGILGFFAGFLATLLYLLAQLSSANPAGPFQVRPTALWLALGTGIAAGFAAERVLRDWAAGRVRLPGAAKPKA